MLDDSFEDMLESWFAGLDLEGTAHAKQVSAPKKTASETNRRM